MNKKLIRIVLITLLISSCPTIADNAPIHPSNQDSMQGSVNEGVPTEKRLIERVNKYWEAVKFRDFSTMFQMEAAALKGIMSADTLRRAAGNSKLKGYSLKEIKIEDRKAVVRLERNYQVENQKAPVPTVTFDPWIYIKGDWYHAQGLRLKKINPSEWEKEIIDSEEE